ncbi:unnamed protein product [Parnassius apollo]|uniref:(apollo) hypothetical protein n=1 Tax=Parnassius apollo TaxID=110799 RepID=A0A8S3WV76_PARAO|nr:unnamed protein product [Parnassius apollo]
MLSFGIEIIHVTLEQPFWFQRYYEFTPEEIKALEECDKESFYQRCLPFSTLFATMTYAAIRTGLFSEIMNELNRNTTFHFTEKNVDPTPEEIWKHVSSIKKGDQSPMFCLLCEFSSTY